MKNRKLIILVSVLLPLSVACLFGIKIDGYNFSVLPSIYASINAITGVILIISYLFIKKGNKLIHERLMMICLFLSLIFLGLYVIYHATSDATKFGGEGAVAIVYYVLLISHILLSMLVVPLVLFSVHYAKIGNFIKHKKIVKWSYPVWLYVAISGVFVYLLISPYYV